MSCLKGLIMDFLNNVNRAQLIRYVAIYMLVAGVLSLCAGVALAGVGVLGGVSGALVATSTGTADGQQAGTALAAASGLAVIYGILSIISGPILIIVAIGLFRRMSWSRMGVVIACAFNAISALLGIVTGSGIGQIIWVIVSGFLAYFFYTDPGIKQEFEKG
jgi:hypothetical protein